MSIRVLDPRLDPEGEAPRMAPAARLARRRHGGPARQRQDRHRALLRSPRGDAATRARRPRRDPPAQARLEPARAARDAGGDGVGRRHRLRRRRLRELLVVQSARRHLRRAARHPRGGGHHGSLRGDGARDGGGEWAGRTIRSRSFRTRSPATSDAALRGEGRRRSTTRWCGCSRRVHPDRRPGLLMSGPRRRPTAGSCSLMKCPRHDRPRREL